MDNDEMEPIKKKSLMERTRPVWKYLPFGSLVNLANESPTTSSKDLVPKILGHIAYGIISALTGAVIGINYMDDVSVTGSWNPTEQNRIISERRVAREEFKAKYAELERSIFGARGFADTDGDGIIESGELLDAYTRMGMAVVNVTPGHKPTTSELETAVNSYKTQRETEVADQDD